MKINVLNKFDTSNDPKIKKKKIITILHPSLKSDEIEPGKQKPYNLNAKNEYLTINVDPGGAGDHAHRVIYHMSFDGYIKFNDRGIGNMNVPTPYQRGSNGRIITIAKSNPTTWQLEITKTDTNCTLPPPVGGIGEPSIFTNKDNVEIGADNQW